MRGPEKALVRPISLDSKELRTDSAPGAGSDRSDSPAFLRRESKDTSTVDTSGVAGRGYVGLPALAETALARKFKHPKGLRWHYTFRIGARISVNLSVVVLRGSRVFGGIRPLARERVARPSAAPL